MDETAQMLSITVEGMKFTFEASKESVEMMLKFLMALKSAAIKTGGLGLKAGKGAKGLASKIRYHKNAGKTTRVNFQKKTGGAGVSYALDKEVYKKMKKYAKKSGLLFYKMESFQSDGKVHILVPPEYVENLKAAMELAYGRLKEKKAGKQKKQTDPCFHEGQETGGRPYFFRESVEDYLKSQGMDTMSLEEAARTCKAGMTKEQAKQFDAFLEDLQLSDQEQERESRKGKKTGPQDRVLANREVEKHRNEIIRAIKSKELQSLVNRTDMVYAEIKPEHILVDKNSRDMVELVSSDPKGHDPARIPKKNFLDFGNGNFLFVAPRAAVFQTEHGTYTAGDIKKFFNRKAENGKNVYSDQFRTLFSAKEQKAQKLHTQPESSHMAGQKPKEQQPKRPHTRK